MDVKTFVFALAVAGLTGCGSLPEERAVSGAGIGAGAGAALGAVTGMSVATGAVIGAAAGALTGGLTDKGKIDLGDPLWKRTRSRPAPMTTVEPAHASASEVVNSIQTSLTRLGYDTGPVDGLMGSRTEAAIRVYQRDHGLLEDGRATPDLADHMWSRGRPAASVRGRDNAPRGLRRRVRAPNGSLQPDPA